MTFWSSHFQYYILFISITRCFGLLYHMNAMCLLCFFCLNTIVDCWKWQVCSAFCKMTLGRNNVFFSLDLRNFSHLKQDARRFQRSSDCLFSIFCSRHPYLHPSSQIAATACLFSDQYGKSTFSLARGEGFGVGSPLEISDASLTTSINHPPSD